MWKLSKIKIENIVSFREAEFEIEQGVATLIFGKNEDNESQPCNGSGKSSLIEAISFAITGEQLRKVKSVEEIINDDAEEAYVWLKLVNDYDDSVFEIERSISRNASQIIKCKKYTYSDGKVKEEGIICPSVLEYNKHILNEIGLTKDDIYNNYILCDSKYESFFDCSDKGKKEIINRFSNGEIVDESISKVQSDMLPVEQAMNEAKMKCSTIEGSINALNVELEQADSKLLREKASRQERINELGNKIAYCRESIDDYNNRLEKAEKRLKLLRNLYNGVAQMEESNSSLADAYHSVKRLCIDKELGDITDYNELSAQYKEQIEKQNELIEGYNKSIKILDAEYKSCAKEHKKIADSYQEDFDKSKSDNDKDKKIIAAIEQEICKFDEQLDKIEQALKENKKRRLELESSINKSTAYLAGAITCPKCKHQFFLDNEVSVSEVEKQIERMRSEFESKSSEAEALEKDFDKIDSMATSKESEIKRIDKKIKERGASLDEKWKQVKELSKERDELEEKINRVNSCLTNSRNELDKINGKIEVLRNRLFGEVNALIDARIINGESFIEKTKNMISYQNGQLEQFKKDKKAIQEAPETDFAASLKQSLNGYKIGLAESEKSLKEAKNQYDVLKQQEADFTAFKSYLAKKKIDSLSLIVNDFLEKIGSDIRLKLEGYTMTKTGKLRDKIYVNVIRDGIDCGSYQKFSGGEKARLNLACILSLHTLTNANCEDGKGLDFIIIDELLDKSDEVGIATYCDALNKLHQTSLLITQGSVSESYPHKLLVIKKQGVSTLN